MSQEITTQLIKSETIANNTMAFTLKRPEGFDYRAGQTVDLSITAPGDTALSHTFSLVSAPAETDLVLATRMRDSEYKNILKKLPAGAEVTVAGPYGSFFLHQDSAKAAVFLVGGIGITPFISIINDAIAAALPHKLYLFYSNRRPEDTAYLAELTALGADTNNHLVFVPTMTDMSTSDQEWSGATGYVDWELVSKRLNNPENAVFYSAGPKAMVGAMRTMLLEHSVNEDFIRTEEFSGY